MTISHRSSFLLPVVALAGFAAAQPTTPGPETKKYDVLVGSWEGSGTALAPGMGEVPWTARAEVRWVLGDFFIEDRSEIQVGAPTPLQMRSYMGWDQENERHILYGFGNNGDNRGAIEEVVWLDRNTLVATANGLMEGEPAVTRSTWRIKDDTYQYTMEQAVGTGPWQTTVDGTFKKVDAAPEFGPEVGFIAGFSPPEMAKMKPLVGDFATKGWFDFPGMGKQDITGTETIALGMGGHVLTTVGTGMAGDMPVWQGLSFVTWNDNAKRYDAVMLSSYGEVSAAQMWWVGDGRLLSTAAAKMMGTPMVSRSVMQVGEHGPESISVYSISGEEAPKQSFSMTYLPKQN